MSNSINPVKSAFTSSAYDRRQNIKHGLFGDDKDFIEQVTRGFYTSSNPFRLKYPLTVGEDSHVTVNYNTNQSSEFAKSRVKDPNGIDETSFEPFVMFDFMEIIPDKKQERIGAMQNSKNRLIAGKAMNFAGAAAGKTKGGFDIKADAENEKLAQTVYAILDTSPKGPHSDEPSISQAAQEADEGGFLTQAKRQFKGSISMYMPTDIQVNDSIVYNENTRKTMGIIEGVLDKDIDRTASQGSVLTSAGTMGAAGFGLGTIFEKLNSGATSKIGKFVGSKGGAVSGFIGAAGASIVGDEYQRSSGKASNPHDYMAYQSTTLRSFTFTFTFLPDSHEESLEVTQIIKSFRSAAHAKRNDALTLTVPDHVIVSHHGAGDMIQLPPCVMESVNVSYNPNNTSFFMQDNNPVEVGLSVTLKEIVPIYKQDVEAGF